jgi:hypothetical protein
MPSSASGQSFICSALSCAATVAVGDRKGLGRRTRSASPMLDSFVRRANSDARLLPARGGAGVRRRAGAAPRAAMARVPQLALRVGVLEGARPGPQARHGPVTVPMAAAELRPAPAAAQCCHGKGDHIAPRGARKSSAARRDYRALAVRAARRLPELRGERSVCTRRREVTVVAAAAAERACW